VLLPLQGQLLARLLSGKAQLPPRHVMEEVRCVLEDTPPSSCRHYEHGSQRKMTARSVLPT
jgi:hypothetical protein